MYEEKNTILSSLSGHSSSHHRVKKLVQFGSVQEYPLDPLPADISEIYYTSMEMKKIKQDAIKATEDAEQNECPQHSEGQTEEETSLRGLEQFFKTNERRRRVQFCVRAVLYVHLTQRKMGYCDEKELCKAAKSLSKQDKKNAQEMASLDVQDVLGGLSNEELMVFRPNGNRRTIKGWVSAKWSKLTRTDSFGSTGSSSRRLVIQ